MAWAFNWSAVDGPGGVFVGVNATTDGWLGIVLVGLVFTIAYFRLRASEPTHESVVAASFLAMITAGLLRLITNQGYAVVNDTVFGTTVAIFLGALALMIIRD